MAALAADNFSPAVSFNIWSDASDTGLGAFLPESNVWTFHGPRRGSVSAPVSEIDILASGRWRNPYPLAYALRPPLAPIAAQPPFPAP